MKIKQGLYKCEWCNNEQKHLVVGKNGVPMKWQGQVICDKCGRYINQND